MWLLRGFENQYSSYFLYGFEIDLTFFFFLFFLLLLTDMSKRTQTDQRSSLTNCHSAKYL